MKEWLKMLLVGLVSVLAATVAVPVILLWGVSDMLDDRADKDDIFRQVRQNQHLLMQCVATGDYGDAQKLTVVKEISVQEDYVEFSCGGAGFGSGTAYCGFFYSESDDLTAIWCAPSAQETLTVHGSWCWEESGGDNRYYVELICGHFYYFEASF